jgi:uroporphyrinogen decarboxylase-like protein
MTLASKERVRRAMATGVEPGGPLPDRVPVFCQLALGHYFLNSGLAPFDVWYRSEGFAEALVALARRYRFDGILVNLPGRRPDIERFIARIEPGPDGEIIRWKNGDFSVLPRDDNAHYFQASGERYFPRFEEVDPEALHYVEPWDATDITYPFAWSFEEKPRSSSDFFPPYHQDTLKRVLERTKGALSVHAEVFSPFSQFLELLNYEAALMALLDDPAKVHACLERLAAGAADLASRQAALGVDAVLISSAFAGAGLIAREHYQEFVLPYEKRVVAALRARRPGLFVYTHTCGSIGDRLDLMLETGTQGIDTLDPPPLGTVELAEAKAALSGKTFIKGNLDPVNTLLRGTTDDVRRAVKERLATAMPGGGYILSTACSVAPATPPRNIEAMTEEVERSGGYY